MREKEEHSVRGTNEEGSGSNSPHQMTFDCHSNGQDSALLMLVLVPLLISREERRGSWEGKKEGGWQWKPFIPLIPCRKRDEKWRGKIKNTKQARREKGWSPVPLWDRTPLLTHITTRLACTCIWEFLFSFVPSSHLGPSSETSTSLMPRPVFTLFPVPPHFCSLPLSFLPSRLSILSYFGISLCPLCPKIVSRRPSKRRM